jgi:GNAT superfamily N-acetyltransferase
MSPPTIDLHLAVAPSVLAVAETLNLCLPPSPGEERVIEPRWALFISAIPGPERNVVQRLRLAPGEVERAVAEVRSIFRARARNAVSWEVTASTTPPDLVEQLTALGMVPDHEPEVAGMVLSKALPEMTTQVTVETVTDFAGFCTHMTILRRCFGRGAADPTEAEMVEDFERRQGREAHYRRYLAFSGGEPIAAGDAALLDDAVVLCGGATLPEARGKGAYRALVAARWAEAVRRGTPALVVQAGSMSRPILERLGFERVAWVRVMVDRFE